jgi:bifunctional non-homologous end joining protein LigD
MLWRTQAPKRRPPGFIEPCIPTRVEKPPVGPQWIHEIKHDGYRLIVRKAAGRVRLFTRRGYDWTDRYPLIVTAATKLRASSATIDDEAVYWRPILSCCIAGRTTTGCFFTPSTSWSWTGSTIGRCFWRPGRRPSRSCSRSPAGGMIHLVEHLEGDGATVFAQACRLGFEGIVSKHRDHPYRSGPSKA